MELKGGFDIRNDYLCDINKIIYNYENYLDDSISENFYNLMKKELNNINSIISK